jgi:sec-independent protein translocase protein TatA
MFGGTFSIMHWLVVLAVVLLLFGGRGKVSAIMGDFGKGLRNFKTGLKGDGESADADEAEEVEVIEESPAPTKRLLRKRLPRRKRLPQRKRHLPKKPQRRKKPPRKAK